MNLFEFQAKELLARYDLAIPKGRLAGSADEAARVAEKLRAQADRFVVKVQVRAGGRGEAGGVKFAVSPQGVKATARQLLNRNFVTEQTARKGEFVEWVLVEEVIEARAILYAAVFLNKTAGNLELLVGRSGGDEIEKHHKVDPQVVQSFPVSVSNVRKGPGCCSADFEAAARFIAPAPSHVSALEAVLSAMARIAVELDATLVEINPLAIDAEGRIVALDAKIAIDDNALFRHRVFAALREADETEAGSGREREADLHHVNFVSLDGNIGVVVNGAGLALATLDLIHDSGGQPANFMDIRTTASSLDIAAGIKLILNNARTKVLLLNVHGGGMQRCDTIAEGLAVAMKDTGKTLPIVARLAGNNAQFAEKRLTDAGLQVSFTSTMQEATQAAARAANGFAA